jgi:4-amino-4-deoxy-L-arabinose transferase-like glycosyltransferase
MSEPDDRDPEPSEPWSDVGSPALLDALRAHEPTSEPRLEIAAKEAADDGETGDEESERKEGEDARPQAFEPPRREGPKVWRGEPGSRFDDEEAPLLPPGNPLRVWRGLSIMVPSIVVAFLLMAITPQFRWGVPVAAVAILGAAIGLLDLLGSFDDPTERVAARSKIGALAVPLGVAGFGLVGTCALISLAVAGVVGPALMAVLVPAHFLVLVVGIYKIAEALGVYAGEPLPLHKRHGFWLVVITTVILLPMLGSHSLSDPWETHYGEVSREILARNDWISTWWAQENWFWSKPVLDFWMQALAMATFGVRYQPGAMLSAFAEGREPWPEWAVRFPIFLVTLLAGYLLYKAVARVFGRRAGFLGALVLTTMPQWFMVAHQTMTDMPFLATMAAAMACVLLGMHTDPEQLAGVYEIEIGRRRLRLSAYHLVMGAVIACALPQILYLFSRNVGLDGPRLGFHGDSFVYGSPGNCGLPGNDACRPAGPVLGGLQPSLQAVLWAQALGLFVYANWGERRVQRLWFIAAWLFAALSTMAKGPAGFGLPVLCALAYVVVSRRHRDLLRMELTSGLLILLCVALPWYIAMYARHGQPFTDRLLFHDMFKRAFTHVHDTNEGDDTSFRFYVWQLGYATFPWSGVAALALVSWLKRREEKSARADAGVFLAMWFGFSFALFSLMLTKFHHYILPAVPPAAMLTGILLDDAITTSEKAAGNEAVRRRFEQAVYGAVALAGALAVFVVGTDLAEAREGMPNQARLLQLFTYNYKRPWPASLDFRPTLWLFIGAAAIATLGMLIVWTRKHAAYALSAVAVLFAMWTLDVYFVKASPHWGQREVIAAYVQESTKIPGPLIAYQMNWKGENFYTGNHVPAFVLSGKKFTDYMLELKKQGKKTFYFITEPHRTGVLHSELGQPRVFDKLTTAELNNKFVLVRARFD